MDKFVTVTIEVDGFKIVRTHKIPYRWVQSASYGSRVDPTPEAMVKGVRACADEAVEKVRKVLQ